MRAKPVALHRQQGTFRPSRHAAKPAAAPVGVPQRPAHLAADEVCAWDELAAAAESASVLTVADAVVLEVAALALAEMRRAAATLREQGATYSTKTPSGSDMWRPNPAQQIYADAQRRLVSALAQLGLTPTTRGRAEIVRDSKAMNAEQLAAFLTRPRAQRAPLRVVR